MKIRADFHMHSTYSDGADSIAAMLEAAIQSGRAVAAISDHAAGWEMNGRMHHFFPTIERYCSYLEEIELKRAFYQNRGMAVCSALEIEVFSDGTWNLDPGIVAWRETFGDETLGVDIRIAAVHPESVAEELALRAKTGAADTEKVLLKSCLAAVRDPRFDILAHPAQAVWGCLHRDFLQEELDALYSALQERIRIHGPLALEINCKRRTADHTEIQGANGAAADMRFCKRMRDLALPIVISSDAHAVHQLDDLESEWAGVPDSGMPIATSLAGLKYFARGENVEGARSTF